MATIVMTDTDLKEMNKATFDAFIQSGKYAFTYTQACEQFGKAQIDILIANKLLKDTSELMGKKRYILSDIIAAQTAFKKL